MSKKLKDWIKDFENMFSKEDLEMSIASRAVINVSVIDERTGEIHLHNLDYIKK